MTHSVGCGPSSEQQAPLHFLAIQPEDACLVENRVIMAASGQRPEDLLEGQVAAELGTAREVVSGLLGNLKTRGAINLSRGRVEMRDEAVLRQLA